MMRILRFLEDDKDGNAASTTHIVKNTDPYFPIVVAMLIFLMCAVWMVRFAYNFIAEKCFGREPPFDPIEARAVLTGLSDTDRKKVLQKMLLRRDESSSSSNKTNIVKERTSTSSQENEDNKKGDQLQKNTASTADPLSDVENDKLDTSSSDDENLCPICLSSLDDEGENGSGKLALVASNVCPHLYHLECLSEWLGSTSHKDCPVCRVGMLSEEEMMRAAVSFVRSQKKTNWTVRGILSRKKKPRADET